MPSPFPGMDPYLEDAAVWPLFQRTFVAMSCSVVVEPMLVDRYRPEIRHRQYGDQGEHEEPYLAIVRRSDDRLVTILDLVSPRNKTTDAGRQAYLDTRRQAVQVGANTMEVDLVLQGSPLHDFSRESLPSWDYAVTVMRAKRPSQYELYTATLPIDELLERAVEVS